MLAAATTLRDAAIARALARITAIIGGLIAGVIGCAAKSIGRGILKKIKELEDGGALGLPFLKQLGSELVANPGSLLPFLGGAIFELLIKQIAGPLSWAVLAACVATAIATAGYLIFTQVMSIEEARARFRAQVIQIKAAACGESPPEEPEPAPSLTQCFPL